MSNYFRGKIDEMRKLEIKNDFLAGGVKCKLDGIVDFTAKFVQNHQLLKTRLWDLFANQFVLRTDGSDGGWRGEYWGKMMRGACMTYQYTQDEELYKTLFNAVQSSNLFKYNPHTKTLLARNFKKKYTNKVETRYGTSFMMYRVSLDRKDYTLRSLIKEFKHLLFKNAVNAKERRDEFKRNGKNKNTTSFTTDYALTQNYLAKKIGVKSRMAVYRLAKELQSSYTLSVTKTPAKLVLENLDEFTPNPTKHYIYDAKSGLMFEFSSNEYNLNSREETERFGNVIFNHRKRQTKYHKKGSVDEYYERYFH